MKSMFSTSMYCLQRALMGRSRVQFLADYPGFFGRNVVQYITCLPIMPDFPEGYHEVPNPRM